MGAVVGRPSRGFAGVVGLLLGAALVAPDAALGQEAAAAAPAPAAQPGAKTATGTLVTRDTVYLTTNPDGRQTAAVKLGPASGHGNFQTVERDGHLYVYPDVAAPYLRSGLLDEHLFDVTELAGRYTGDLPLILEYQGDAANAKATRSLLAQPVPAGARKIRDLVSVASVAVKVPGTKSADFWESVDDDRPAAVTDTPGARGT